MEFELSSEQVELRDAAAGVLERLATSAQVRACIGSPDGLPGSGFDRELWAALADQGWLAIEHPVEEGGLGLGMVEVSVLSEQLGRFVAPVPFFGTNLALRILRDTSADDELPGSTRDTAARWASSLATGESVGCLAWSPQAGRAEGEADAGTVRLTAVPEPTPYASVADVAVVVMPDAVYGIELGAEERPPVEPAMDRTRPLSWLRLDHTLALRLGGAERAAGFLDRAATATAAEMLGSASRVLEMSVAYAKDRQQFGKPIGSFQSVKHRLADALVDVEAMRSAVYFAAWSIAAGEPTASLAASAAKAWCSDASARIMASGLQVHGGIGFTWEHDLHLFVKRSQLDQSSWGHAVFHRERVASMLSGWKPSDPSLF